MSHTLTVAHTCVFVCFLGADFGEATGTTVASVVDLNEERALQLATDVGSVQAGAAVADGTAYRAGVTETIGTAVQHAASLAPALDGCDMVYIGTTPGAHAPLVIEALAAGKHVLMEKPLAATPEDADAIVAAAEAAAGTLSVGMNIGMRWNPALAELRRQAVEEKTLGDLTSARLSMHYTMWPREWQGQPWCAARAEGGPLREVGTHWFFGIMECFGHGCVTKVKCDAVYPDGPDGTAAETAASGVMVLDSGLEITMDVRTDSSVGDLYELEVVGEAGSLMLTGFSQLKKTAPGEPEWIIERGSYGRVESVTTLVDAARGGDGAGLITPREGRNAQRLLDALLASGDEWLAVSYD